jgi:topoisomerase-4 subunit A
VKAREEFVVMAAVIPQGQSVTLFAGKRKLTQAS